MNVLLTFLTDVMKGFGHLHSLARRVRISPAKMLTFDEHAAYNTSALLVTAALLTISINFFSPAVGIGFGTGLISALLSLLLVGVVGFFVNLAAPSADVFVDRAEPPVVTDPAQNDNTPVVADPAAHALANKWASYLILNFVVLILTFIAVNSVVAVASGGSQIAVTALRDAGIDYDLAVATIVIASSLFATSVVFWLCRRSGKIVDGFPTAAKIFAATNLVCASLFYVMNFVVFT